jgi:hypothetical protein
VLVKRLLSHGSDVTPAYELSMIPRMYGQFARYGINLPKIWEQRDLDATGSQPRLAYRSPVSGHPWLRICWPCTRFGVVYTEA